MPADARGYWAPHYTATPQHIIGHHAAPTATDTGGVGTVALPVDSILSRRVLGLERAGATWDIPATNEITVRFRVRQSNTVLGEAGDLLTLFNAGGFPILRVQKVTGTHVLRIWNGTAALGIGGLLSDTWIDYSISVILHDSAGQLSARLGGANIFTPQTGLDTQENAGPCTSFKIAKFWGVQQLRVTDVVWTSTYQDYMDTPGTVRFSGVTADVGTNQWTPDSGSADHYTYVDEAEANESDWLQASANALTEIFQAADPGIAAAAPAAAVGVLIVATKPNSGSGQIDLGIRVGAGPVDSAGVAEISDIIYGCSHKILETNPNTSLRYTGAELANAKVSLTSVI